MFDDGILPVTRNMHLINGGLWRAAQTRGAAPTRRSCGFRSDMAVGFSGKRQAVSFPAAFSGSATNWILTLFVARHSVTWRSPRRTLLSGHPLLYTARVYVLPDL